ncbi:hypothetical protein MIND_00747300 [Mycena indigotica]|uniref:Uncharacterized protein n=1 Tax=Mycena indigotica TaxID=2126181 RepID=A0A8H6SMY3_9AGAR|nr:uncharacterized protein MIND_00747300 [Mycena indigotica]KAF7301815.1 hypothetical protein MIND_00747300 [Mycena indigotica]
MHNPWAAASWPSPETSDDAPAGATSHPALLRAAHSVAARSSIHGPELLFLPPSMPSPPLIPPRPPEPPSLRRNRTVPHPLAAPPAIPPKPLLSPPRRVSEPPIPPKTEPPQIPLPPPPIVETTTRPELGQHSKSAPEPSRNDDDDDAELAQLAAVIALSQAESLRKERLEQKIQSQEEADLARAMEASLSPNAWSHSLGPHSTEDGPSHLTSAMMIVLTPMESEFPQSQYMDDETFARMLAAQDTPTQSSFPPSPIPLPSNGLAADEKFALKLAAEEEKLTREEQESPPEEPPDIPVQTKPPPLDLPKLEPADLPKLKPGGEFLTWVDSSLESPVDTKKVINIDLASSRSTPILEALTPGSEESEGRSPNASQYVDADLLLGVSIGFVAPMITSHLVPLSGSMPNIVSLPYGRCPPLHLQAPSWRHLLKLMARLSGTRFEPTVEALAVARSSEMHLRTVVQFVRLNPVTPDWRAILWFTIDHPVPASMPNSRKFTNGDVDVLPWSYTLSSLPALLRDSADTPLSKCYTIPATNNVPFPALPISFPNMALYLQAALEESRRQMSDSGSGVRKLAKMLETCYPTTDLKGDDERSRMGGLLKKLGRKDRRGKKGKGGGNEDTYELVTPFVLDEWGP